MYIKQECDDCGGTGLYSGFCEAKGEAVICVCCGGKGWRNHFYKPFVTRRKKKGIKFIRQSRGRFLMTGVGGHGKTLTYAEFEKLIPCK